jgi:hypothetical protein
MFARYSGIRRSATTHGLLRSHRMRAGRDNMLRGQDQPLRPVVIPKNLSGVMPAILRPAPGALRAPQGSLPLSSSPKKSAQPTDLRSGLT